MRYTISLVLISLFLFTLAGKTIASNTAPSYPTIESTCKCSLPIGQKVYSKYMVFKRANKLLYKEGKLIMTRVITARHRIKKNMRVQVEQMMGSIESHTVGTPGPIIHITKIYRTNRGYKKKTSVYAMGTKEILLHLKKIKKH